MTFDAGASTKARDVSRDANGNVEFSSAGTGSTTATQTGVTNTTTVSGTGKVMYDKFEGGINTGTADLSLLRNSNVITSETGVTSGGGVFAAGTPRVSSPDWSLNAVFNNIPNGTVDAYQTSSSFSVTQNGSTETRNTGLQGGGSTIYGKLDGEVFDASGTAYISVNGSVAASEDVRIFTPPAVTTTVYGNYSDPNVTFKLDLTAVEDTNTNYYIKGTQRTANLYGSLASATITASKNEVTTVS